MLERFLTGIEEELLGKTWTMGSMTFRQRLRFLEILVNGRELIYEKQLLLPYKAILPLKEPMGNYFVQIKN